MSVWSLLREYARPYRWWIALALALNAVHGVAISFQTLTPKYLLDDVLIARGLATEQRYVRLAWLVTGYLLASLVGRMLAWHCGYRIFTRIRERVVLALRAYFFRRINYLCLRFHGAHNSGELFSYLFGSPLAQVQQYFQQMAMAGPGAVFTLASSLIWVLFWDVPMTLVLTASVFISVWMMHRARQRMRELHTEYQAAEGSVSGRVADLIRGTREVKLYAIEEEVIRDFEFHAGIIGRKSYERDVKAHRQYMKQETVGYFCFVLLCCVGAWRYLHFGLKEGQLLAYLGAFIALQGPLQQLFQIAVLYGGAQASLARLNSVMEAVSTTPDPAGNGAELPARGEVVLNGVHFAYDSQPVLQDISLCIRYGQRVALVGPSGAGKTTLAQLLLRLYDPQQGDIRLDGVDLRRCRGSEVRRRFGVVPQQPYFFHTTIRENFRIVRPEIDDAAIRRACETANAWEFIARMPQGLDTEVGESGASLSGGQRQRLAIARALLSDPPFFIFDEATSALDSLSEELIQVSLKRILVGRTAIFIAHRLTTVKSCDRVIVLERGRVVQDSSYERLAAEPGLFRQMVESDQLRS
jgi:ABC-type multidrug transport system fused ATPase/permease subunit